MLAFVSIPGLELQILANRESRNRTEPLAIISADRPSAHVGAANSAARERGIRPGMRYSQVLALAPDVYAGVVGAGEVRSVREKVRTILLRYAPDIEETSFEPAQYWVSLKGLRRLFSSPRLWREAVWSALVEEGFQGYIAFGAHRLDSYIKAKLLSFGAEDEQLPVRAEREWIEVQRLALLPISPADLEMLYTLGIRTIGAFTRLSSRQVKTRFSRQTVSAHTFVTAPSSLPVRSTPEEEVFSLRRRCEPPLANLQQICATAETLLKRLMRRTTGSGRWVRSVEIVLVDEESHETRERIHAASSGRDGAFFLRLIELRLDQMTIRPVTECTITFEAVTPHAEQRALIEIEGEGRDEVFDEGRFQQLLVLLQAEYGEDAICRAEVHAAHLPEEQFVWIPVRPEQFKNSHVVGTRRADRRVRRIYAARYSAPLRVQRRVRLVGYPELISTHWWRGDEVQREYFAIETAPNEVLWVYREGGTDGRWFVQGKLE